jgi:hypothetical protein
MPASAHSTYLQLPSISGGLLLHTEHENAPCSGEKGTSEHQYGSYLFLNLMKILAANNTVSNMNIIWTVLWKEHQPG